MVSIHVESRFLFVQFTSKSSEKKTRQIINGSTALFAKVATEAIMSHMTNVLCDELTGRELVGNN